MDDRDGAWRVCKCPLCLGAEGSGTEVSRSTWFRHARQIFPDLPVVDEMEPEEDPVRPLRGMNAISATLYELILLKENRRLSNTTLTGILKWAQPMSVLYCRLHLPEQTFEFPKDWKAIDRMMSADGMPAYETYTICYCRPEDVFLFRPKDKVKRCPHCQTLRKNGECIPKSLAKNAKKLPIFCQVLLFSTFPSRPEQDCGSKILS